MYYIARTEFSAYHIRTDTYKGINKCYLIVVVVVIVLSWSLLLLLLFCFVFHKRGISIHFIIIASVGMKMEISFVEWYMEKKINATYFVHWFCILLVSVQCITSNRFFFFLRLHGFLNVGSSNLQTRIILPFLFQFECLYFFSSDCSC